MLDPEQRDQHDVDQHRLPGRRFAREIDRWVDDGQIADEGDKVKKCRKEYRVADCRIGQIEGTDHDAAPSFGGAIIACFSRKIAL